MGLVKRTYTDNSTVITAQNLNDIQDSAIDSEVKITKLTPITGSTDPTTSTAGALKQIYLNTVNGKLFMCTAISGSTYTWTLIASGGGGGAATWGSIGGTMSNQVDLTAALDGKTEAFPVTISGSGSSMTADKTNEEIYEAVTAGKYVYIVTGSIATPYVCTSASIAEAYFVALEYVDPSHIYVMGYKIISDVVTEMNSQRLQTRINDDERLPAEYVSYDAGNTDVESALTSHATQLTNTSTQIANLSNSVGDAWSASVTYAVGKYCIRNNILYRCIVQNTNQAPPNTTYWTQTSVGAEMNSSATTISTLTNSLNNLKATMLQGDVTYYVSASGSDSNNGSFSYPFATIQKALSVIPKNLNGYTARINLKSDIHATSAIIVENYINGNLYISVFDAAYTIYTNAVNGMQINNCDMVYLYFGGFQQEGGTPSGWGGILKNSNSTIMIGHPSFNTFFFAGVSGGYQPEWGVYTDAFGCTSYNSNNVNVTFSNVKRAIYGNGGARTMARGTTTIGDSVNGGFEVENGATTTHNTVSGTPAALYITRSGGRIYSGGQSNAPNY